MNKKLRINLLVSTISLFLTFLLMIFVIFGWYISNKTATASGINASTAGEGNKEAYYIGTEGSSTYSSSVSSFWSWLGIKSSTAKEYTTSTKKKVALTTTAGSGAVSWGLSSLSNIGNYDEEEATATGIQPSSYGTLEFYIIPTESSSTPLEVKLNVDFKGYKTNDESYVESNSCINQTKTHILFFKNKTNGVYSDWIDSTWNISIDNPVKDTAYKYTIYWIWPPVLSQLLLKTGNDYLYGRKCLLNTSTQEAIVNNMKTQYLHWFTRNTNSSFTADELISAAKSVSDLCVSTVTQAFNVEKYRILNSAYNNTDQLIGDNIDYLKVELKSA